MGILRPVFVPGNPNKDQYGIISEGYATGWLIVLIKESAVGSFETQCLQTKGTLLLLVVPGEFFGARGRLFFFTLSPNSTVL